MEEERAYLLKPARRQGAFDSKTKLTLSSRNHCTDPDTDDGCKETALFPRKYTAGRVFLLSDILAAITIPLQRSLQLEPDSSLYCRTKEETEGDKKYIFQYSSCRTI